jgi:hypothetical protein
MDTTMTEPQRDAQQVRWGRPDDRPAGIIVLSAEGAEVEFIPWAALKRELETRLLPQLFADPHGFTLKTADYHGKSDWLVQVVSPSGEPYCDVWFGPDPESGYAFDGLVRVGDPEAEETPVWQVYQRFSDGTYRRLAAVTPTIDSLTRMHKGE